MRPSDKKTDSVFRKLKKLFVQPAEKSNAAHRDPRTLPLTAMAYPLEPRIMFDAALAATGAEVMDTMIADDTGGIGDAADAAGPDATAGAASSGETAAGEAEAGDSSSANGENAADVLADEATGAENTSGDPADGDSGEDSPAEDSADAPDSEEIDTAANSEEETANHTGDDSDADSSDTEENVDPETGLVSGDDPAGGDSNTDAGDADADLSETGETAADTATTVDIDATATEVIFINSSVLDAEQIADDLPEGAEVVYLTAGEDGVREISDYLADRTDIATCRIISHGNEGFFVLNGQIIDNDYLAENGETIAAWYNSLTDDGDILLYGCNVAASDEGKALVDALAALTGADVAASTDTTGGADGDWELEYVSGMSSVVETADDTGSPTETDTETADVLDTTEDTESDSAETETVAAAVPGLHGPWQHRVRIPFHPRLRLPAHHLRGGRQRRRRIRQLGRRGSALLHHPGQFRRRRRRNHLQSLLRE